jgi:[ribosomal protein S18]-alanine N-acetyltransferase
VALTTRSYTKRDFAAIYKLDQECFPPGISYSKWTLRYYLNVSSAICLLAEDGGQLAGLILAESVPPTAHIITLDISPEHRRKSVGSLLLQEVEQHFLARNIKSVLLETAVDNEAGIAFWQHHGYRTEAVLKRYYLGRIDAFEMRKYLDAHADGTS